MQVCVTFPFRNEYVSREQHFNAELSQKTSCLDYNKARQDSHAIAQAILISLLYWVIDHK